MQPTFEQAIDHMKKNCEFSSSLEKRWDDKDFRDYESTTKLKMPTQLEHVLRTLGDCYVEYNDGFLATYESGACSVHNTQILLGDKDWLLSTYDLFVGHSDWPDRFKLPMVFFGSADGGNAYLLMHGDDPDNNAVYLWERATDPWGTGDNAMGLAKVADHLYEFFFNLKPEENL